MRRATAFIPEPHQILRLQSKVARMIDARRREKVTDNAREHFFYFDHLWSCLPSGGPFRAQEVKRVTKNEDNIIAGQRKWRRCDNGTKDQCFTQYQASCRGDASGRNFMKFCIGVCHWKNARPTFHLLGSNARCVTQRLSWSTGTYFANLHFRKYFEDHILKPLLSNFWSSCLCHARSIVCHGCFESMSAGGPITRQNNSRQCTWSFRHHLYKICGAQLQKIAPM